ncbi:hypothetical protein [Oryza sativa Japonica Group]|uniref:Uncharacterized protein n=1 Tax=Oryza sativa subsp. japonica TaxID=39947 RepID=Q5N727_ORYSJ|nr:hypothetical protein [Oryza sativa Japonica Group]
MSCRRPATTAVVPSSSPSPTSIAETVTVAVVAGSMALASNTILTTTNANYGAGESGQKWISAFVLFLLLYR